MWIQPSLLTFALGLLPCLTNAQAQVPAFSTLKDPFILSVQDHFNIVLKYYPKFQEYVPVLSHAASPPPAFQLTEGNITTVSGHHKHLTAFYGPVVLPEPPVLAPIGFGRHPSRNVQVPFTAVTHHSGILRLWALNGREFPILFQSQEIHVE